MPRKPRAAKRPSEILAPIPAEILDQIVRDGPLTAAEVDTATRRFKKAPIERAWRRADPPSGILGGRHEARAHDESSQWHERENGTYGRRTRVDRRARGREGTFEPQLIGKHERRFTGFDDKVIALYAQGLTARN